MVVKQRARGVELIADLNGDAFGLGLVPTAKLLRAEGVRSFAVSDPNDAEALRAAGFTDERLMMTRSTADAGELRKLVDLGVVCTVGSSDAAIALNGIAEERRTVCEAQIKVDSGLGRYGFTPLEIDKIAAIYQFMPKLAIVGVFSSYSQAWKSRKTTVRELETFKGVLDTLRSRGFDTGVTHICDSAALFRYDLDLLDAVRIGTAFSGRVAGGPYSELTQVGYIQAGIEEVGWFPKGHHVGSDILKRPTKLAVLSVGYYHGFGVNRMETGQRFFDYIRLWRRCPSVRINGERVRIVGEIGMMHTVVDVTKLDCHVGDAAIMDVDPVNVKGLARLWED